MPKLNHVTGFLDLVYTRTIYTSILIYILEGELSDSVGKVLYVYYIGDLLLPLARLEEISEGSGREFRQL